MKKNTFLKLAVLFGAVALVVTAVCFHRVASSAHKNMPAAAYRPAVKPFDLPVVAQVAIQGGDGVAAFRAHGAANVPRAVSRSTETVQIDSERWNVTHLAITDVFPQLPASGLDNWRDLPESMQLCVLPGLPIDFKMVRKLDEPARLTWIGEAIEKGYSLVSCSTEKFWDGVVIIPGGNEYAIHASNEGVRIVESYADKQDCGPSTTARELIGANVAASASSTATVSASRMYYFDVLFFYQTGCKAVWGATDAEVLNRYASFIATTNKALADSLVSNFQFRAVAAVEVTSDVYGTTTTDMNSDLDALDMLSTTKTTSLGLFAQTQRNAYGADTIQMVVHGTRNYAGLAWVGAPGSVIYEGSGYGTSGHELGHNAGCHHDRITDSIPDTDTHDWFGYMNIDPTYTSSKLYYGCLMSYAGNRLPYFSNADLNVQITYYNGTKALVQLGVPTGQTGASNLARYITAQAPIVTAWRTNTGGPAITSQPKSVSAYYGDTITLSVTATGSGLSYQWYKASNAITGATDASYTVTISAIDSDAGNYYVVVTNSIDSVTSTTASVALSSKPVSSSPSGAASSGGGGGGGGAPGEFFFTALAMAALVRFQSNSRRKH